MYLQRTEHGGCGRKNDKYHDKESIGTIDSLITASDLVSMQQVRYIDVMLF